MKKIFIILGTLFTLIIAILLCYGWCLRPISNLDVDKKVVIENGTIDDIAKTLKSNHLIRSVLVFKIYVKLTDNTNLKASTYTLKENMSVQEIVKILAKGNSYNPNEVKITFKEGINIREVAKLIADNTNNSEDDVFNLLNNEEYINSIIDKYWFLTDEIKNSDIYYPLEGYLFPNTYIFLNKDVEVKDIFTKMLDEMETQLEPLKEDIEKSSFSIHELLTLASLVEKEGAQANDRQAIAGVIYNRLMDNWSLGLDTTTYYAFKIDDWNGLNDSKLHDCTTKYNTRCNSYVGLPVGPIANPGIVSIKASLNPTKHDKYYFVSDCKGKVYLSKNDSEQQKVISKLKNDNNWCP